MDKSASVITQVLHYIFKNIILPSQLSFESGLSKVLLFTNKGLVGIKGSTLSFLFAESERSILRPETEKIQTFLHLHLTFMAKRN